MRVLLVHSRSAGTRETPTEDLATLLRTYGFDPVCCPPDQADLEAALAQRWDFVAAAGGDGTVARLATMLPDRAVPLAILPLGGGNNIARAFGIHAPIAQVVAGWRNATRGPLDIGVIDGSWGSSSFVEAVGFGLLTEALVGIDADPDSTEEKLAIGRDAFRQALIRAAPEDYRLVLEGETIETELLMLEVMNIPAIGPRLMLAPRADPGDGLLEVVWATVQDREPLLDWLATAEGPAPLPVRRARTIEILSGPDCVRPDDPKRTRSTHGAPVRIGMAPVPVTLLLPRAEQRRNDQKEGDRS